MQKVKNARNRALQKPDVESPLNLRGAQGDAGSPIAMPRARTRKKTIEESRTSVLEEYLFRSDGRRDRVLTLDANSSTFTSDLTLVFKKNVARARREHKKKLMSAGRVD